MGQTVAKKRPSRRKKVETTTQKPPTALRKGHRSALDKAGAICRVLSRQSTLEQEAERMRCTPETIRRWIDQSQTILPAAWRSMEAELERQRLLRLPSVDPLHRKHMLPGIVRLWPRIQDLEAALAEYARTCEQRDVPMTWHGIASVVGLGRTWLGQMMMILDASDPDDPGECQGRLPDDWKEDLKGKLRVSEAWYRIVKAYWDQVAAGYEERLTGRNQAAGSIFALKQMGWRDTVEHVGSSASGPVSLVVQVHGDAQVALVQGDSPAGTVALRAPAATFAELPAPQSVGGATNKDGADGDNEKDE